MVKVCYLADLFLLKRLSGLAGRKREKWYVSPATRSPQVAGQIILVWGLVGVLEGREGSGLSQFPTLSTADVSDGAVLLWGCPVRCGVFPHETPEAAPSPTPPSFGNPKCFQTLPQVSWGQSHSS